MNLKKLTISAMLVAVAVILSSFSIPIGPSRCFPIQHMVNVLAAVFLGPVYGVSMAFCTALIRNLLGTGSLLAFPGSMVGAFVSAMIFKYTRSKIGAYLGEVIGTGILGGMLCYPIASMMMGQKAALFTSKISISRSRYLSSIYEESSSSRSEKSNSFVTCTETG